MKKPGTSLSTMTRNAFVTTLLAATAATCGTPDRGAQGKSISVDHEVIFREFHGGAKAIARLAGGELVVTGVARTAWVIATDGQGVLLWKYEDPVDERNFVQALSQTEYAGIVQLANGNALLCGRRNVDVGSSRNLILILDSKGNVVEQREEVQGIDTPMPRSRFDECLPWSGGALLFGSVSNGLVYHAWMVTLDGNGKKKQESLFDLGGTGAGNLDEPSFIHDSVDIGGKWRNWHIDRVSSRGKILASRDIVLSQVDPVTTTLRNVEPTSIVQIVGVPLGKNPIMYTLNSRLEDVVPPTEIYDIDTTQGMGYVRRDGSLALFGRTSGAAIAWIDSKGQLLASHVVNSKYQSYTVRDAVPVSANQFVTIRDGVTNDPNDRGLLMDWVTFNQESVK
jgi:hypothetical protein